MNCGVVSWRLAVVYFLAGACVLPGQSNLGSITGTVQDQTGAVVRGAKVEIKNNVTGASIAGGSSETGKFTLPAPFGTYQLTITSPSFKKYVQTDIPVVEGVATRRDVTLEVGSVNDVMTVTDRDTGLKTEGGDISYRVTTRLVNQLPVLTLGGLTGFGNVRNPLAMTQLLPGVQFNPIGINNVTVPTLVVNGLPANTQTWLIEGQDATPTLWRGVTSDRGQAGVDAIESMTVQTSNFAAEYGKAGGAAINFTMRSGTNTLHGSAYEYLVNELLHAGLPNSDWVNSSTAANNFQYNYRAGQHIRNRQRRNDYGFTVGGPIVLPKFYDGHDRSFFFFSLEQFREEQIVASGTATVPTAAYRQGDFTSAGCSDFDPASGTCRLRQAITQTVTDPVTGALRVVSAVDSAGTAIVNGGIYDPTTYRIVNGFPVRNLFPNQRVPATSMDRVALNIQNLMPAPSNGNLTANYIVPAYQSYRYVTLPSIKLDHNVGSTLRISGYWGQTIRDQNNANGFAFEQFPWTNQQNTPYHNDTVRVNLDKLLTATLNLHVGVGYLHQREPSSSHEFDQSAIGLPGSGAVNAYPYPKAFPTIGGLSSGSGGFTPGLGAPLDSVVWEQKPTANLNLTWTKSNHTFKFGGDVTIQGYPTRNRTRANGQFGFNAAQSGNPWTNNQTLNLTNPTGFGYASFLLGSPDNMSLAQQASTKMGSHALAFFAQDNWKVTRRLTLEYGLRYDFQTYLREQYGRFATASFSTMNPAINRMGGVAFEATCKCSLSSNYPFAFGPRASASYQLGEKTVLRAGFGINYNVLQTPAGNSFTASDFFQINAPSFGLTPLTNGLQGGNVFYTGNPYGNTEVVWPSFDPGRGLVVNGGVRAPTSPNNLYHPGARPARIAQWSVSMQREVIPNLIVEAAYLGNRGAWFYSPLLDTMAMNTLGGGQLERFGLDIHKAADRTLLGQTIGSTQAAARGFFSPYAGFPTSQPVGQAIRPVPQWGTTNPYLGPFRGNTWYDALQVQVTKRYSHNLDLTANFTYSHSMVLGVSSDSDFFVPGRPQVTDPFNRGINKQLNQLSPPLKTVISGTYTTPGLSHRDGLLRWANLVVKDWQVAAVLQYQSGELLTVPTSTNQLSGQLRINAPAAGLVGILNYNPWNFINGSPFFRPGLDPNGTFDPRAYDAAAPNNTSVLAGGLQANGTCSVAACAWSNPADGEWGVTAPYLEGFRWRRRPSEAFNFGRNFRMGRAVLNVRAEFQNIFNRLFYSAPTTANPNIAVSTTTQNGFRIPVGGYGVVNTLNGSGSSPRLGTLVARITF